MKLQAFAILVVILVITAECYSEKVKKHKKYRHRKPTTESSEEIDSLLDSEAILRETETKLNEADAKRENERARELFLNNRQRDELERQEQEIINNNFVVLDPCSKVHCSAGKVCNINEDNEPECVCIDTCPSETDPRRKVCTNHNETWDSDCSVYQQRCWCETGDSRCREQKFSHFHIEYYGECREIPQCTDDEMADFPRRMRDWLFNIMRDLADRDELKPHYHEMEREAEKNLTRRWTNAAIWKWCDLDGHPHDRSVSRHELFPIRAPLVALEHCIAPFLNSCDQDNDHRISLKEWGKCLELDEDDLEDRCEEIEDSHNNEE